MSSPSVKTEHGWSWTSVCHFCDRFVVRQALPKYPSSICVATAPETPFQAAVRFSNNVRSIAESTWIPIKSIASCHMIWSNHIAIWYGEYNITHMIRPIWYGPLSIYHVIVREYITAFNVTFSLDSISVRLSTATTRLRALWPDGTCFGQSWSTQ